MKYLDLIVSVLLIIGGLNWGLVALFDFNIVSTIFGTTALTQIIYILVGASAVYQAINWKKWCIC